MKLLPSRFLPERPLRLPRLSPYVPQPTDPPIFWFNAERDDIVREAVRRIVEQKAASGRMELVLNDVAYHESERLERQRDAESRESLGFWRGLLRRVGRMSDAEKRESLRSITEHMVRDIAGNFDPRVYAFATKALPKLLTGLMNPSQLHTAMVRSQPHTLDGLLITEGAIPKLRHLATRGTLVFVPTHSSNLDSIVLGYALMREGLPPVSYGAGKNLFTNPLISFFMHNLGAYRLDRRVKAGLYKEALKSYSTVLLERGYHSLFFPGGTRSRSGMIEQHLKLGLAGTALEAFARNQSRGIDRPLWFVPTTINYALVLEAESLIEEHLKEQGKARYIVEDDEFSSVERWLDFLRKLSVLSSACVIRFGEPMDPFANPVDDEGRSLAPDGRVIAARSYVQRRGEAVVDAARDAAYTTLLGEAIAERFLRETVIMSTQLVAHVLFRAIVSATPGTDLFGRMRHRGDVSVPIAKLCAEVGEARDALLALEHEGLVRGSPALHGDPPEQLVERALQFWTGYHGAPVATHTGAEVVCEDPALLHFYGNRLVPFATRIAGEAHLGAAREIARMGQRA
jgi:glycerol-3-phosphate O-acyltransferase